MSEAVTADTQVSFENDGKVLTGIGAPSEALTAHMDRLPPDDTPAKESGTGAAAGGDAPAAAPEPSTPQQTRGQKRFSELTHERDTARAETTTERTKREAIEKEVVELRAKVQQAATPQQAAQAQQQLTRAEDRQQAQPVNGQRFAFPAYETAIEQYPDLTYDQWQDAKLEAFGQWKDAQFDARIQARFDNERTTRSLNDHADSVWAKGRSVYKDFDQMRSSGPGAPVHLGKTDHETMERNAYVLNHPRAEHIAYAILKDGDLARRLQQASALQFGSMIAEIAPQAAPASTPAQATPPVPYQPVGSGSSTATATLEDTVKRGGYEFDKSGYREMRARQRGVKSH